MEVGAFLSGGIDSSLIVGIIKKELGKDIATFNVNFAEDIIIHPIIVFIKGSVARWQVAFGVLEGVPLKNGFTHRVIAQLRGEQRGRLIQAWRVERGESVVLNDG